MDTLAAGGGYGLINNIFRLGKSNVKNILRERRRPSVELLLLSSSGRDEVAAEAGGGGGGEFGLLTVRRRGTGDEAPTNWGALASTGVDVGISVL